jgi:hypothetical protein
LISFLALHCKYDRENCLINLGTEGASDKVLAWSDRYRRKIEECLDSYLLH